MQMDTPIALTNQQMLTVTEVARRLSPHLRGQYLQIVANLLSDVVVGDASVQATAIVWKLRSVTTGAVLSEAGRSQQAC
jgi:hypothetical protein